MTTRAPKTFGILQTVVILGAMVALLGITAHFSSPRTLPAPRSLQSGITGAPVRIPALLPAPLAPGLLVVPSVTVGGDARIGGTSPASADRPPRDADRNGPGSGNDGGPAEDGQAGGPAEDGHGRGRGHGHGSGSPPGGPPGSQGGGRGGGNDGGHGNNGGNGGNPHGNPGIAGISSTGNGPPAHAHGGTHSHGGDLARCRRHVCVRVGPHGSFDHGRSGP